MGIKAAVRRRLAIGAAGAMLASTLIVGVASVAADDPEPYERDVNVGRDATGLASDAAHFTITSVAAPVVDSDVPAAPSDGTPIIEGRDDRT
jgi:hypothetical protein